MPKKRRPASKVPSRTAQDAAARRKRRIAATQRPEPPTPPLPLPQQPYVGFEALPDITVEQAQRGLQARPSFIAYSTDPGGAFEHNPVSATTRIAAETRPASTTVTLLPPNWPTERATVLSLVDTIESALQQIAPILRALEATSHPRGEIGGNFPPEPIDPVPFGADQLNETLVADRTLRIALSVETPSFRTFDGTIRLCGLVFRRSTRALGELLGWLGRKGDIFLDECLKSAGSATGKALVGGVVAYELLARANMTIAEGVVHIERWLHALHLPL